MGSLTLALPMAIPVAAVTILSPVRGLRWVANFGGRTSLLYLLVG